MRSHNRFLFIVDMSSGMKRHATDTLETVDKILRSSASGQLHPGDTIGVWTFNESLHTGILPLQTWEALDIDEIALRTTSFLHEQKYEKKSVLSSALGSMLEIIKRSDIITVFIISDGSGKMAGTPFDEQLNALYARDVADMKRDPHPIVTVLQAQSGEIIKYTENALPWPVVIPELPIPIKNETKAVAVKPAVVAPPVAPTAPQPALTVTNTPPLTVEQQTQLIENQRAAALQQSGAPAPKAMLPQPKFPPPTASAVVAAAVVAGQNSSPQQPVTPAVPATPPAQIANIKPMGTLPDPNQPAPAPRVAATNRPAPIVAAPKPAQAAQTNAPAPTDAVRPANQVLMQAEAIVKSLTSEPRKLIYVAIGALALLLLVVIIARVRRANRPSKVSLITSTFNTPHE
jgi:hypothetical protein